MTVATGAPGSEAAPSWGSPSCSGWSAVVVLSTPLGLDAPYSAVGPGRAPRPCRYIVGGLLLVCAVLLAVNVLRGGHGEAEEGEDVDLDRTQPTGGPCCPLVGGLRRQHRCSSTGSAG